YDNIELIIGCYNILKFDTWKQPDNILQMVKLIVLNRKIKYEPNEKDKYYKSAIFVDTPFIEISATEIRNRVRTGKSIDFLVPKNVNQYIYNHNLYKD
ncbi:MAG: nicotinate (nicotinamide) nucleotide adenylyltransferase, partial [Ignavibacteriaceae bacterium]|nr:nicotinate (nicotinamide) nucleotide adenylyltransferase [Ignavibacteriaceae bacterium]